MGGSQLRAGDCVGHLDLVAHVEGGRHGRCGSFGIVSPLDGLYPAGRGPDLTIANPSVSSSHRRWYAVALLPHADALARDQLEHQGFEVFAPTLVRTVRHARQFRTKTVPLFPGYLFVHLDLADARWRAVNGTRGVRRFVMAGDRPARVPDSVIEALWTGGEGELQQGDEIEIVAGPLAGLRGRLERLDNGARVAVLIELLQGSGEVNLQRESVRATD